MFKFSKNKEKFTVNEVRQYRLTKWSTITTLFEGQKLLKTIAPSFAAMADMKIGSQAKPESLDEIIEGTDIEYMLTGAITQLSMNFSDEHFEELVNKLLQGLEYRSKDEENEWGDFKDVTDWSEHFDEHPEDFEIVVVKSIKVNLYDFFMKQATVRSSIEKVLTVVKPLANHLNKSMKEDSTKG